MKCDKYNKFKIYIEFGNKKRGSWHTKKHTLIVIWRICFRMNSIEGNYSWEVCIILLFHRNLVNNITCYLVNSVWTRILFFLKYQTWLASFYCYSLKWKKRLSDTDLLDLNDPLLKWWWAYRTWSRKRFKENINT